MERRTSMTDRMRKNAPKAAPAPEPPATAASKAAVVRRPSRSSMPTTLRQNPNRKSADKKRLVNAVSTSSRLGPAPPPNLRGRGDGTPLRTQSSYAGSMRSFTSDLESISEYNTIPSHQARPPRSITHSPPPVKSALKTSRPPSIVSADGSEMRKSVGFSDQESDDGRSERMRSPARRVSPMRDALPKVAKVPKLTTTADGKTLLKPPSSDLVEKKRVIPSQAPPQALTVDSAKLGKEQSQAEPTTVVHLPKSAMKKGGNKKKRKEDVPVLPPIRHPSPLVKQNAVLQDAPNDSSDSASLYSDAEDGLPSILEALHEERPVSKSTAQNARKSRVSGSGQPLSDGLLDETKVASTEPVQREEIGVTNVVAEGETIQPQGNVECAPPLLSTNYIISGESDGRINEEEDVVRVGEGDGALLKQDERDAEQKDVTKDVDVEISSPEVGDMEEAEEAEETRRIAAPSPRPFTSPKFTRESSESERPALERHYSSESDTSFRRARPRQPRMRESLRQGSHQRPASLLSEDLDDQDAYTTKKPAKSRMRDFFPASRGGKNSVASPVRPAHQRTESNSSFTKTVPRLKSRGLRTLRTSSQNLREAAPKNYNQSRYASSTEEDEAMDMGHYRTDDEPTMRTKNQGTRFFSGGQRKRKEDSAHGPEPILSKRTGKKKRFQFLRRLFGITD